MVFVVSYCERNGTLRDEAVEADTAEEAKDYVLETTSSVDCILFVEVADEGEF